MGSPVPVSLDGLGDDSLVDRAFFARWLGLSTRAIERNESMGLDMPPFIRIGGRARRYRVGDLRAWMQRRTFRHRADELAREAA